MELYFKNWFTGDLPAFTKEVFNAKLGFCAVSVSKDISKSSSFFAVLILLHIKRMK